MRKFFSFRSSASSSANSNPTPAVPPSCSKENIYWETPRQNDGKYPVGEKIQDVSQMLDDSAFKPVNRYPECEVIPHSHHRSLSFCSAIHSSTGEGNLYYLSNLSGSPSTCGSSPCHVTKCHAHFDKIIKKEIPSTVAFEDDKVLAFRDISPQAPTYMIIIPKVKDGIVSAFKEERHIEILGYLLYVAKLVAKQEGLDDGFRIVINDGPKGCQSVYHIHVHLLGGRQMNWPPG